MSLFTFFRDMFFANKMNVPVSTDTTEKSASGRAAEGMITSQLWEVDAHRRSIHIDIDDMDNNDEIVSQALDQIADTAVGFEDDEVEGFYLDTENKKVERILTDLFDRTSLRSGTWNIIRRMVKYGNEFLEIVLGDSAEGFQIVRLKGDIPEHTIYPKLDLQGNQDPNFPWYQRLPRLGAMHSIAFEPWQLGHFHYGEMDRKVSVPVLKSARRNWRRLQHTEDSMALARMNRAYIKLVHHVPVDPSGDSKSHKETIEEYKKNMTTKEWRNFTTGKYGQMEKTLGVNTDYFLPEDGTGQAGIDTIDPKNTNLWKIDDVNYARERLICRLGVPQSYLNLGGQKAGKSSGEHEERHFARKIRKIQSAFKDGINFICRVELICHGLDPTDPKNDFVIGMAEINSEDIYRRAQAENTYATALGTYLKVIDIPPEMVMKKYMRLNERQIRRYKGTIKLRSKPNPALAATPNDGGRPTGRSPGSNDNNGKTPTKDRPSQRQGTDYEPEIAENFNDFIASDGRWINRSQAELVPNGHDGPNGGPAAGT